MITMEQINEMQKRYDAKIAEERARRVSITKGVLFMPIVIMVVGLIAIAALKAFT